MNTSDCHPEAIESTRSARKKNAKPRGQIIHSKNAPWSPVLRRIELPQWEAVPCQSPRGLVSGGDRPGGIAMRIRAGWLPADLIRRGDSGGQAADREHSLWKIIPIGSHRCQLARRIMPVGNRPKPFSVANRANLSRLSMKTCPRLSLQPSTYNS